MSGNFKDLKNELLKYYYTFPLLFSRILLFLIRLCMQKFAQLSKWPQFMCKHHGVIKHEIDCRFLVSLALEFEQKVKIIVNSCLCYNNF